MTLSSTLSAQLWSFPQLHNMPHITSSRHQSLSSNLPLSCQGQIFGHLHRNAISRWLLHVLRPFLPIALFHRIYFWVILIGPCVSKIFRIRSYIYRRNVSPPDLRDRLSRITDLGFVEYPRRTPGYYITPPRPNGWFRNIFTARSTIVFLSFALDRITECKRNEKIIPCWGWLQLLFSLCFCVMLKNWYTLESCWYVMPVFSRRKYDSSNNGPKNRMIRYVVWVQFIFEAR